MKKLIKISFLSLSLTLFCTISYGRVIGNLTLGIPTVTVTDADMIAVLAAANTNEDCEFTNFSIVSKNITYNPSTNNGFFLFVVSYTEPVTGDPGSTQVSIPITYDPGNNEFEPVPNGGMGGCVKKNCIGCVLDETKTSCSACAVIDQDKPASCNFVSDAGGGGGGCGDWWVAVLLILVSWFGQ